MRRLLPPMWMFGAVVVTAMIVGTAGARTPRAHPDWWWCKLAFWVLPLSTPPFADACTASAADLPTSWAEQIGVPLWYCGPTSGSCCCRR